jgi:hypothetical protein
MKNKLISKAFILLILTGTLSLSACLKDSRFVDFSQVGTLVDLPLAAYNGAGKLTPEALPITATPQTIAVVVNVASPKPLSSALTVTLAVDQAALTAYNTANSTNFVLPPAGSYSVPNLKVTVPANQRQASLNVQVNTSLLDPAGAYVIPISITDASGQKISNYHTILLNVQAKNKYDGVYDYKGYILRAGDPVLSGNFTGLSASAATLGANSIGYNQVWATGSQTGGVNAILLTVDPSTNAVTVTSQVNASLTNAPGYNSRYDPSTKTFYVSFVWSTPGTRAATDTLTYSGPRP